MGESLENTVCECAIFPKWWEAHDGPKKRGNALEVTNSHVCDGNLNATTITYLWGLITIQCVSVASLQELDVVTVVMRISTH
mmetsp:Transcript_23352/g.38027  ORF Transcript_23352/g.38027 Transcript_23352/m.38027 type:complete len:82 (+) Transcript_23352:1211-1456(+)